MKEYNLQHLPHNRTHTEATPPPQPIRLSRLFVFLNCARHGIMFSSSFKFSVDPFWRWLSLFVIRESARESLPASDPVSSHVFSLFW